MPPLQAEPSTGLPELSVVADAVCTFCGCACDDIELAVAGTGRGARITQARNACASGERWFLEQRVSDRPEATIDGRPATYDEAIDRAAEILANARYPLTFGLTKTTSEAQRVAVAISDWIGGHIDTPASLGHGPSGVVFSGAGEITCTMGEIRHRADFLIFWGCDPAATHPRHFTRYSLLSSGRFIPEGRRGRYAVQIGAQPTETAKAADLFLQVQPDADFELAWTLRALARGIAIDGDAVERKTGIPLATLDELIAKMKRAKFGVILFGPPRGKLLDSEAILALARDLNEFARWFAMPIGEGGNTAGAGNVLSWSAGYPFGVSFHRGYPQFGPGEFTAEELLARGEADAALIVAGDPMPRLSQPASEHLGTIPVIVLDHTPGETAKVATIAFASATYGINTGGTVYRTDGVPLPLRPAFESPYRSDCAILSEIERRIREHQQAAAATR